MSANGDSWHSAVAWAVYLAGSAFGHAALKRAAGTGDGYDLARSFGALVSPWGLAAMVAWGLSAWAWTLALTRCRLVDANAVSALRVVLCAIVAWAWLGERLGARGFAGTLLVAGGVWLLRG